MKVKKFSPLKAAKMSRLSSKVADRVLHQKIGIRRGEEKLEKISKIAAHILRIIPFDEQKYGRSVAYGERFEQSISRKASKSLKNPKAIGRLHCVERCNTALGLLRKAGIKAWLARQVYYDFSQKEYRIHDYVEFFHEGKVHTLAFGINFDTRKDYFAIYNFTAENILADSGLFGMPAMVKVLRGIDSSQIGGATDYNKLKRFLRNPFTVKESMAEMKRLNLLVSSGVIPKQALEQIKNI